jgi:hypothetical protein
MVAKRIQRHGAAQIKKGGRDLAEFGGGGKAGTGVNHAAP